ncbi:Hypothetical protein CAP_2554 [Chondromyces apiculatus DSM 436]|uniref:Uncharacterized protein n=1 Tax=Chondromyces apiculatus DSM 436 TaxID=1192034 RepID=A0A017THE5_9BACT|nr:Hypothetical protein CAP_2554 [Chondromyces apiculatus DSM 436]
MRTTLTTMTPIQNPLPIPPSPRIGADLLQRPQVRMLEDP